MHSEFRILELPLLDVLPLLPRRPALLGIEIAIDCPKNGLDLCPRRPRVQRSSQMRMQLLGGAEHRGRRYRAVLAPLEIEDWPPDDLAVSLPQAQVPHPLCVLPRRHG